MYSADEGLDAVLGVVDGPETAAGRGQVVGEVAAPLGEHAQQGEVGLEPGLGVVGVEVLIDGHTAHGRVTVAELGQPSLGVETVEQGRGRAGPGGGGGGGPAPPR